MENGETDKIMESQISANLYSQLYHEGREIFQFKGTIDHKNDGSAMKKEKIFTLLKVGHKKCNPTTRASKVLLEWQDETTTWSDLKYVKEDSPIELAQYAVSAKIDDEPAFAW